VLTLVRNILLGSMAALGAYHNKGMQSVGKKEKIEIVWIREENYSSAQRKTGALSRNACRPFRGLIDPMKV